MKIILPIMIICYLAIAVVYSMGKYFKDFNITIRTILVVCLTLWWQ